MDKDIPTPSGEPAKEEPMDTERQILRDLGYFGHFLHMHAGGRSGKQHILRKLLANGGHLTQRELAEHTDLSSAALSEVLSKLEAEGLIARTRSDVDRRQLDIALTEKGDKVAHQCLEDHLAFRRVAFAPLAPEERERFLADLEVVRKHWTALEESERSPQTRSKEMVAR